MSQLNLNKKQTYQNPNPNPPIDYPTKTTMGTMARTASWGEAVPRFQLRVCPREMEASWVCHSLSSPVPSVFKIPQTTTTQQNIFGRWSGVVQHDSVTPKQCLRIRFTSHKLHKTTNSQKHTAKTKATQTNEAAKKKKKKKKKKNTNGQKEARATTLANQNHRPTLTTR